MNLYSINMKLNNNKILLWGVILVAAIYFLLASPYSPWSNVEGYVTLDGSDSLTKGLHSTDVAYYRTTANEVFILVKNGNSTDAYFANGLGTFKIKSFDQLRPNRNWNGYELAQFERILIPGRGNIPSKLEKTYNGWVSRLSNMLNGWADRGHLWQIRDYTTRMTVEEKSGIFYRMQDFQFVTRGSGGQKYIFRRDESGGYLSPYGPWGVDRYAEADKIKRGGKLYAITDWDWKYVFRSPKVMKVPGKVFDKIPKAGWWLRRNEKIETPPVAKLMMGSPPMNFVDDTIKCGSRPEIYDVDYGVKRHYPDWNTYAAAGQPAFKLVNCTHLANMPSASISNKWI